MIGNVAGWDNMVGILEIALLFWRLFLPLGRFPNSLILLWSSRCSTLLLVHIMTCVFVNGAGLFIEPAIYRLSTKSPMPSNLLAGDLAFLSYLIKRRSGNTKVFACFGDRHNLRKFYIHLSPDHKPKVFYVALIINILRYQ